MKLWLFERPVDINSYCVRDWTPKVQERGETMEQLREHISTCEAGILEERDQNRLIAGVVVLGLAGYYLYRRSRR